MQVRVEGFRSSLQQRRLWQLQQQGGRPRFGARCAMLLEGPLAAGALRRALSQVIARHEILRTRLQYVAGMRWPIQVVADGTGAAWSTVDLSDLDPQSQQVRVEESYREATRSPTALEQDAEVFASLVKLAPDKHWLIMRLPATCADAWSLKNLARELVGQYGAAFDGGKAEDEPLQYSHFAEWQKEVLEDESAAKGFAYWEQVKSGGLSPVTLPFENRDPAGAAFEPDVLSVAVEPGLASKVEELARRHDTSSAACLLAVWQALLWRLSGQPNVVVNYAFDGRKYEELRDALGLFARHLPVRTRCDKSSTLEHLLRQVDDTLFEAARWQEYFSWEQAGEDGAGRDSGQRSIAFEFSAAPPRLSSGDLIASLKMYDAHAESYGLKLTCRREPDALVAEFSYLPALFTAAGISCLARQFRQLLASAVKDPSAPVTELNLLDEAERHQLLFEFNETGAEYPRESCVHELFEEQAAKTPDATALVFEGGSLSYGELNSRANQLARHLRALGAGPEQLVAILMERSAGMVVALLGVLKSGAAYLPLDPAYPERRLELMLSDSGAGVILTQEALAGRVRGQGCEVVMVDAQREEIAARGADNLRPAATPDGLAYVIYTSGSTGTPKGVMIHHRPLVNYLHWASSAYAAGSGSGSPLHSPLAFDLCVTALFTPLLTGSRLSLVPEGGGVEPLADALSGGPDFSLVKLTPAHLEALSHCVAEEAAARSARRLVIGGEALRWEALRWWREHAPSARLVNEYGPTEAVVGCCVYEAAAGPEQAGAVPIGRGIANARLYVLDAAG
ncbi:MAG TPA: AMP-binding protein, partial [Pyrinomonadaceae bacterium]